MGSRRNLVHAALSFLPDYVWHRAMRAALNNRDFIDRYGMYYLGEIAKNFNITEVTARGDYGSFVSASVDQTVIRQYGLVGKWPSASTALATEFFRKHPAGTYLDIGANIGMTVVPVSQRFPDVQCFAFEPDPTNYKFLQKNVQMNCAIGAVTIFDVALFNENTRVRFELSPDNVGDHRVRLANDFPCLEGEQGRAVIEVTAYRLDDIDLALRGETFVKIDTQGAEPFIFEGGANTLSKAEAIFLEFAPYHMGRTNADPMIVVDFAKANFKFGQIFHAESEERSALEPINDVARTLVARARTARNDPKGYCDVYLTKAA